MDYIHFAVHYIPVAYVVCNRKLVPLNPIHLFHTSPTPIPLATSGVFSVFMRLFLCYVYSFVLCLVSTHKWDHMVFVFLCLTCFTWHDTLYVHLCCHKRQGFIFKGWIIFHCVHTHTHTHTDTHTHIYILCGVYIYTRNAVYIIYIHHIHVVYIYITSSLSINPSLDT